jgi:hypothetical protein
MANATAAAIICPAQIRPDSLQSQLLGGHFFFQMTDGGGIAPDRLR